MSIFTPRLELISATEKMLEAELEGRMRLQQVLNAQVPTSWPPELYDAETVGSTLSSIRSNPDSAGWWLHYFLVQANPWQTAVLIGAGGYKGPPEDGTVEIGYSILQDKQRRGYALEAIEGLVAHAFSRPGVRRVIAHTPADGAASIGALEKAGFQLVNEGGEAETIRYQITREEWKARKA